MGASSSECSVAGRSRAAQPPRSQIDPSTFALWISSPVQSNAIIDAALLRTASAIGVKVGRRRRAFFAIASSARRTAAQTVQTLRGRLSPQMVNNSITQQRRAVRVVKPLKSLEVRERAASRCIASHATRPASAGLQVQLLRDCARERTKSIDADESYTLVNTDGHAVIYANST